MDNETLDDLVNGLSGGQSPRVWSWVVTVFGELAREPGSEISGNLLHGLAGLIGIKPEAIRVALHRLRKDEWIVSRRNGRNSVHLLSEKGQKISVDASRRIYGTASNGRSAWLVLADPGFPVDADVVDAVPVGTGMWIMAEKPNGDGIFSTPLESGHGLPDWVTAKVCPADLVTQSCVLADRLAALRGRFSDPEFEIATMTPLQVATLRVMIVHDWRRLILKAPTLPEQVFPDRWHGAQCRAHVSWLLSRLRRPSLSALETTVADMASDRSMGPRARKRQAPTD